MNHTASGTKSQLLTGGYSSQVGATRSFKVYPGDKVKAEVYAKYWNNTSNTGNLTEFAAALTTAFGLSSGSTGLEFKAYQSMKSFGSLAASAARPDDVDTSPKGFVTILLFDKNYNLLDAAWDQLDATYVQTGLGDNDPFDYLVKEMTVKEEGYAYIFLSNENSTQVDIHFDDLKVTHTKTNVIQYNEYYPFGLSTSTSWTRENSSNNYLYNAGNELNSTSGWYDMFYRNYDPSLGRMLQVDPYSTSFASYSPYNYSLNSPALLNDPTGGYVYANAAADRIDKINGRNDPNYFDTWSETFKTPGMILYDDAEAVRSGAMSINAYAAKYSADPSTTKQFAEMLYDILPWAGNNPDATTYNRGAAIVNQYASLVEFQGRFVDFTTSEQIENRYLFIGRLLLERGTPWMDFAESQLGQKEKNPGNNSSIIGYHATAGGFIDDETPWCSSFVNWNVRKAGINGTNSPRALSWNGWGKKLNSPAFGSIAVIDYGGGKGHVGFVAGINSAGKIILLGGNQSDMVKYSAFSAAGISSYVYPAGYTPSYNLPILNIGGNTSYSSTR